MQFCFLQSKILKKWFVNLRIIIMMRLVIDIGNTNIKLAVFNFDKIVNLFVTSKIDFEKITKQILKNNYKISKIIISSVSDFNSNFFDEFKNQIKILFLDYNFKFPFKNIYETPKTVGLDRLALASAAFNKFPKKNVLVIDVGTCITYDFIDSNKFYHGGAISPGLKMRYTSLNQHTKKLPLLVPKSPDNFLGRSTKESIHSGIVFGIINEIEGMVNLYNYKYNDLVVILTGGDANFLRKQLKISIFVFSNFLLEGLNFLLETNTKKCLKS